MIDDEPAIRIGLAATLGRRGYAVITANAKKRLTKAAEFVASNNGRSFYDETIRALWGYLSDKLAINRSELTKENIEQVLEQTNKVNIKSYCQRQQT